MALCQWFTMLLIYSLFWNVFVISNKFFTARSKIKVNIEQGHEKIKNIDDPLIGAILDRSRWFSENGMTKSYIVSTYLKFFLLTLCFNHASLAKFSTWFLRVTLLICWFMTFFGTYSKGLTSKKSTPSPFPTRIPRMNQVSLSGFLYQERLTRAWNELRSNLKQNIFRLKCYSRSLVCITLIPGSSLA